MDHRCVAVALLAAILCPCIQASEDEDRLIGYLFSDQGYNPLVRPTRHSNETLVVSFGLLLVQLIHVYEKEQIMKTNTWLHLKWFDSQLQWNPAQYGGIDKINVPFLNVWTPDVVLFNNADGNYEVTFKSKVVLMHTGEVNWVPPAIYKSSCRIDVKYFPFDTQECEMRFASWTYNAREVIFTQYNEEDEEENDLTNLLPQQTYGVSSNETYKDDYLESGTWDVTNIPSKFVHYRSNGSSSAPDYIEVVFLIQMSRKTLYYTVNLIVPTGLMSILICIVFCLPTAAGEKMTLCMSILLALNLFQLLVTKILPPTSAVVPLIAKYLLFTFTLNVLVIVNTVVITNFYYRNPMTHTMPPRLRWFFLHVLPPILLMESPRLQEKRSEQEQSLSNPSTPSSPVDPSRRRSSETGSTGTPADAPMWRLTSMFNQTSNTDPRRASTILMQRWSRARHSRERRKKDTQVRGKKSRSSPRIRREPMRQDLEEALESIRYIAAHCAHESVIESIRDEWKFIAAVIDRLQFVIFSSVTIAGTLALFAQVPHLLSSKTPEKLVRFSNPNVVVQQLIPNA